MTIRVQGVEVFLEQSGAGEPVLLLHGNPDTAELWDEVVPKLRHRHRCFAIDLPGFGRSRAPADFDCSFENLGRFVDGLVQGAGIEVPLNLVAHDFGGAFAMAWAALHPRKVRRLVVMNHPFFVAEYRWHRWARIWRTPLLGELSTLAMDWWPLFHGSLRSGSKQLTTARIRRMHARVTPATKRMILRLYRAADPREFQRWEPRMREATARIPTLVLWGEHDPYIPGWVADRFGARRVRRLPESGHWVPAEVPDQVAEELLRFFGSDAGAPEPR